MILSELITYLHLIGFALGFGGAMISDAIFFSSIRDKIITKTEYRFMQLGGKLVWLGLALLFSSGIGLVALSPAMLQSSKFLIKLVVVIVITLNGCIFHIVHLPKLRSEIDSTLVRSKTFLERSYLLTVSGGISVASWFSAALLGSLPGLPFSFLQLLGVYCLILTSAMIAGLFMNKRLFFS